MSHSNTQRLTDYWRRRRSRGSAPLRASIDPCDFADLLPQVFILGRAGPGKCQFRLSGGLLEDLHGRDLRQADFLSLWSDYDRAQLQLALESALRRGQAMVIEAEGETQEGQSADFEILMAPMISHTGEVDRFLGLYQPTSSLSRLLGRPLDALKVVMIRPVPDKVDDPVRAMAPIRLAALDGRRIA